MAPDALAWETRRDTLAAIKDASCGPDPLAWEARRDAMAATKQTGWTRFAPCQPRGPRQR
jgi:hypothetical protein